jgi:hypothetical protein
VKTIITMILAAIIGSYLMIAALIFIVRLVDWMYYPEYFFNIIKKSVLWPRYDIDDIIDN